MSQRGAFEGKTTADLTTRTNAATYTHIMARACSGMGGDAPGSRRSIGSRIMCVSRVRSAPSAGRVGPADCSFLDRSDGGADPPQEAGRPLPCLTVLGGGRGEWGVVDWACDARQTAKKRKRRGWVRSTVLSLSVLFAFRFLPPALSLRRRRLEKSAAARLRMHFDRKSPVEHEFGNRSIHLRCLPFVLRCASIEPPKSYIPFIDSRTTTRTPHHKTWTYGTAHSTTTHGRPAFEEWRRV